MTLSDFHASYFAHEVTKRCASKIVEKLTWRCPEGYVATQALALERAVELGARRRG